MGAIIAMAVCALIFFGLFMVCRREYFGEDAVREWPEAEGTIVSVNPESGGSYLHIEFWDGERMRMGYSIKYVGASSVYRTGDKVVIKYQKFAEPSAKEREMADRIGGRWKEATVVLKYPKVDSLEKKQIKKAWLWLVVAFGLIAFDLFLIVQHFMGIG